MRIKKFLVSLIICLITGISAFSISSCDQTEQPQDPSSGNEQTDGENNGGAEQKTEYTVTYNANGGVFADGNATMSAKTEKDAVLTAPASPQRTYYKFNGWSKNSSGTEIWNFATDTVTGDLTLYAVWKQEGAVIFSVDGASIENKEIFMLVNHTVDSVSLANKIVCSDESVWKLYYDKLGQMEIPTKIAASSYGELDDGDNVFYIVVTSNDGTQVNVYELNVYRSYAVNVNYYDGNTLLKTETAYTGYEFTTTYTPNITGYTFNDWNYTARVLWDGLNLYADKTANTYKVTYDVNGGDELTTTEKTVTYDSDYTLTKPKRTGYTFLGWYYGSTQLTNDNGTGLNIWNIIKDLTVTAKWERTDLLNFEYTSNSSGIVITGIKDTTVSKIIVPDDVVSISKGVFSGCTNLMSITIPFVGGEAGKTETDTYQYPFGYIFGTSEYTGGTATKQYYYRSSTSSTTYDTYYIPTSLKSVTVTGGNILYGAFYNCSSLRSVTIPDSVTSIGAYAFSDCSSLESITIGEGVTSIGRVAFNRCYKLVEIYNKSSLAIEKGSSDNGYVGYYALNVYTSSDGASKLITTNDGYIFYANGDTVYLVGYTGTKTELILPDNYNGDCYAIYKYAFYKCSSLTSVTIGDSVTSIGEWAFSDCSSLESITIGDGVTSIGYAAFSGCSGLTSVTIGDSVTSIGDTAFFNCSSLTSITIPDSVTSIGSDAFAYCSSLTSITIPDSVTSIGSYAFAYCSSLTSITIPDSVTSIGYYAFSDCSSLTSVTIPDSVTSIGGSAFRYCSSLTSITIPDSVTSIGYAAFSGCSSLTSVTIGDGVTSIGKCAFEYCRNLTSVTIGDGVTSIGQLAFRGCNSLTSITIPDGVTYIDAYAFYDCDSLTSITIPDGVTYIDAYAFYDCDSLTSVYYKGTAEEWSEINMDSNNTELTSATRYYYIENEENVPTDGGNYWHYVDGVPTAWVLE